MHWGANENKQETFNRKKAIDKIIDRLSQSQIDYILGSYLEEESDYDLQNKLKARE